MIIVAIWDKYENMLPFRENDFQHMIISNAAILCIATIILRMRHKTKSKP